MDTTLGPSRWRRDKRANRAEAFTSYTINGAFVLAIIAALII